MRDLQVDHDTERGCRGRQELGAVHHEVRVDLEKGLAGWYADNFIDTFANLFCFSFQFDAKEMIEIIIIILKNETKEATY